MIASDTPARAPSAIRTRARGGKDPGRQADDFYRTPASCSRALLAVETLPHRVWEPACGDGAISRVLEDAGHDVLSTDLVDRGYGEAGRDFLMEHAATDRAIVTNPPFSLADSFVLRALDLGAPVVALLMRLAWLEGQARAETLWRPHPPSRVWVFSARQTLWRGDQARPEGANGGAVAYGWFVWTRDPIGAPALGWLAPEPDADAAPARRGCKPVARAADLFAEAAP